MIEIISSEEDVPCHHCGEKELYPYMGSIAHTVWWCDNCGNFTIFWDESLNTEAEVSH